MRWKNVMQNRPKSPTVYDDCSASLTNCQTVPQELKYKLRSFLAVAHSEWGPFLWPGFLAILLVPVTVNVPSLETTVFCLAHDFAPLSAKKGIILFSLLILWCILPPAIWNAMTLIRYHEITLTDHRTLDRSMDRSILHFYNVMRH